MTRKEQTAARNTAFNQTCLEYRIACLKHILSILPVPELADTVEALEAYRDERTDANKGRLTSIYKGLKKKMQPHGYSALGELYEGVRVVCYSTLHPVGNIWNSDCQRFTEARFLTGNGYKGSYRAQDEEYKFQQKLYDEMFDTFTNAWRPKPKRAAA